MLSSQEHYKLAEDSLDRANRTDPRDRPHTLKRYSEAATTHALLAIYAGMHELLGDGSFIDTYLRGKA